MRAIEYFLSHQNEDRDDVVDLEGAMRRRGLASWRDRRSLAIGDSTESEIKAAIEVTTTGFLYYATPRILTSNYVWDVEWPSAHARQQRELAAGSPGPYRIAPLLIDGLSYRDVEAEATKRGRPNPATVNGDSLNRGDPVARDGMARTLLRAALKDRAAQHASPFAIRLTTFPGASTADTDVLVDWAPGLVAPSGDWPAVLAAVQDLKEELATLGRPIVVDPQARLSAAFAFGHAFPLASRIDVTAIHRGGDHWRVGSSADMGVVDVRELEVVADGDPSIAVVEASFGRAIETSVRGAVEALGLRPGHHVAISGRAGAVDSVVAATASFSFGRRLRELRDAGVREAHVFLAAPAALVLLLGRSINAGPAMTLYHTEDGVYVPSLRLGA